MTDHTTTAMAPTDAAPTRVVWKYPLTGGPAFDRVEVRMPKGAVPLTVALQDGIPTVWAACDLTGLTPVITHRFFVVGTGRPHELIDGARFLGTYFDGPFVFHVFYWGEGIWP